MSEEITPDRKLLFPGNSDAAKRMRSFDWSKTDLPPLTNWPEELRIAVNLCLTSSFPNVVIWGRPEYTMLYNDGYGFILGETKHPFYLGRSMRECWAEVWHVFEPEFQAIYEQKRSLTTEDTQTFIKRKLPLEEVFLTFSVGPISDKDGVVKGLFGLAIETTEKVITVRRLEILRKLSLHTVAIKNTLMACEQFSKIINHHSEDISFAVIYLLDATEKTLKRVTSSGLTDVSSFPELITVIDLHTNSNDVQFELEDSIRQVFKTQNFEVILDLNSIGLNFPGGKWPESANQLMITPIPTGTQDSIPTGVLVLGASPRRVLDNAYSAFFELVARHIGANITNAKLYEAECSRTKMLSELDNAKTQFFSNISHEFRTPLTLIINPIEEALKNSEAYSGTDRKNLIMVHRNAIRLQKLVNTLLDFSSIESGQTEAYFELTDIDEFTSELASNFRSIIENAGLRFTVHCEKIEECIYIDREMWEKIILNLLSNAFKFTFSGEIEVLLSNLSDTRIELAIRDTGCGISSDELPYIFDRFYRIKNSIGRTHEGTGIGLALVRDLILMHGGEITANSILGKGTVFYISMLKGSKHLPPKQVYEKKKELTVPVKSQTFITEMLHWSQNISTQNVNTESFSNFRILIVDDNNDMCDYLVRLLKEHWLVQSANNGQMAFNLFKQTIKYPEKFQPFDLILTDIMMPNLDGFQLLNILKADSATSDIPIIMLSARAGEESRIASLQAGADDYLVKPFSTKELIIRIRKLLNLSKPRKSLIEILKEADRRKDNFLAMLSHELRNPLAVISNSNYMLSHMTLTKEASQRAQATIERQIQQITRLVDDLLDVTRITQNKIQLQCQLIDLNVLAGQTIDDNMSFFANSDLRLIKQFSDFPLFVYIDPIRISQVISNLLQNATQFSLPGGLVCVHTNKVDEHAIVRVLDDGIGIEADVIEQLYEPFMQADRSLHRSKGGLGLGLALVKGLIELHGGEVNIQSEGTGKGAEFIIKLPLAKNNEEINRNINEKIEFTSKRKVLIIDDNIQAADSLSMIIETFGHTAHIAYTSLDGIKKAEEIQPHFILCDIGLPFMNGYEVAAILKANEKLSATHLIALSGYAQPNDIEKSYGAGFDKHLAKPPNLVELKKLLKA